MAYEQGEYARCEMAARRVVAETGGSTDQGTIRCRVTPTSACAIKRRTTMDGGRMGESEASMVRVAEAVEALTVGVGRLLPILARHTDMLKEILKAVTVKAEGPSPLERALTDIFASLNRIENEIARIK
jgi:hypothetical protein